MSNLEQNLIERLDKMEDRLDKLEGKNKQSVKKLIKHNTIPAEEMEVGHMAYVGRYVSEDGSMSSIFGDEDVELDKLLECNSFEMAKVIDAFSSEDRINIVKELIKRCMTARELMERVKFQTTGKLYHHLSFLEKIGVIRKDSEFYHVSARYINCVMLIFAGVEKIIHKNNTTD